MSIIDLCNAYHFDYYGRTVVVSIFSLVLFRLGHTRLFSQLAAYDLLIFIILGALLGTAIINKELFISSLICCVIITLLHRLFGYFSSHNAFTNKLLKGERVTLYTDNQWHKENLEACSLNKADVYQELRSSQGTNSIKNIKKIIMECNGKISFLEEST